MELDADTLIKEDDENEETDVKSFKWEFKILQTDVEEDLEKKEYTV